MTVPMGNEYPLLKSADAGVIDKLLIVKTVQQGQKLTSQKTDTDMLRNAVCGRD